MSWLIQYLATSRRKYELIVLGQARKTVNRNASVGWHWRCRCWLLTDDGSSDPIGVIGEIFQVIDDLPHCMLEHSRRGHAVKNNRHDNLDCTINLLHDSVRQLFMY